MTTGIELDVSGIPLPTPTAPTDTETDIEVLKAIPKAFAIDCEDHANWLLKKVCGCRAYAARVKEWAEQELRRAEREEDTLMFLFGRQIESWSKVEIAKLGGRRKSLNFPAAVVGFRTSKAHLRIDDEKVVLVWAKKHCPEAVISTERLSKTEVNAYVAQTGELPDAGAEWEAERESFFIR